ncbi:efflux RND transporter periplasmic adaptor subunit [Pseudoalteromonas sp. JBTF-M23]|uniref:Efflux RND transporter periplasmic adaptor subunit n=1 Tax=Pseudoalteromonas caenipelagi TaxID=2726988 RepID=A0A849VCJ1_9GAMM|nr:efflux RND transporter periplasmic adaptor subunit [Pseudoalteromonas caenipelagi]NOU49411.1 efflux RND transporter periplasmic adaptor subunit [Pseudoalteromonas caenipelagi]
MQLLNLILFFILLVWSASLFGKEERPATIVITQPIQFLASKEQVTAVGTADAWRSVVLYPAVADRVTHIGFKSGDRVNKGDLLFQLDDRQEQAKALQAKIQLDNAKRALARLQDSIKKGAATQSALDDAQTLVELAQVAVTQATNDIQDHRVVAPFSGVVGITDIEVGDWVTNQIKLVSLDDRSLLYVDFKAPEHALSMLKNQRKINVVPWHDEYSSLLASIADIDSRIDDKTRTIRVRALLNNENDQFLPGMSFKVILTKLGKRYASIPEAALMWGPNGPYVWLSQQGAAKKVEVQVVQRQENNVLVRGDIQSQEILVVEGVQRLREGQKITSQFAQAQ